MGNSVIYRPAYDAEVEYLESDGNSYIDTGLKASSELGILAHIQVLTNSRWLFGGANGYANKALSFLFTTGNSSYRYGNQAIELGRLSLNTTYEFDSTQNHNVMKVGSLTFTATASTFTSDYNFYLFTENRNGSPNPPISGVRIYDFKIYQNSALVRDFIPVRIGSTGYMYDKTTKQLFGNKGTGSFTLGNDVSNAVIPQQRCVLYFGSQRSVVYERIYEEYEWLVGDGSAYINTGVTSFEGIISIKLALSDKSYNIFGRERSSGSAEFSTRCILQYIKKYGRIYIYGVDYSSILLGNQPNHSILIDVDNDTMICDGQSATGANLASNVNGLAMYLFAANSYVSQPSTAFDGKIASFSISNLIDLVPCKLLIDIPAYLDGNNTARTAGTCGMWDKVNDVFYGNVANSGSFTVSND